MERSDDAVMTGQDAKQDRIPVKDANLILFITLVLWLFNKFVLYKIPLWEENIVLKNLVGKVILTAPGLLYLFVHHKNAAAVIGMKKPGSFNIFMAFSAALCCVPVQSILNAISMLFVKNRTQEILPSETALGFVPALILAAVLPALAEEFVFRGILYRSYRQYSVIGGALISALAFGLMHFNLNQLSYTVFSGIIFALMAEASGSIVTSVFMHFLGNAIPVLLHFLIRDDPGDSDSSFASDLASVLNPFTVIIVIAIAVLMLYLLYRIIRKTAGKNQNLMKAANPVPARRIFDLPLAAVLITAAVVTILHTKYL